MPHSTDAAVSTAVTVPTSISRATTSSRSRALARIARRPQPYRSSAVVQPNMSSAQPVGSGRAQGQGKGKGKARPKPKPKSKVAPEESAPGMFPLLSVHFVVLIIVRKAKHTLSPQPSPDRPTKVCNRTLRFFSPLHTQSQ